MCSIAESADAKRDGRPIAPVNKIIGFSSVDGPGNRTAIFLQGCNYACSYCHNPETIHLCSHCGACVNACPVGALSMEDGRVCYDGQKCVLCDGCIKACKYLASPRIRWMDADQVLLEAKKHMPFVRGITISGGECTLWREFLIDLANRARQMGLNVLLDSNGSHDFSQDAQLMQAIDGVMLDIKAWDEEIHAALAGQGNEIVKKNLCFLLDQGKLEEVRTVIAPNCMDAEDTVDAVSRILAMHGGNARYKIISYRPMGVRAGFKESLAAPDGQMLRSLANRAAALGVKNIVIL